MKFFAVLAFFLAVASATPFPQEIYPRNLYVDTIEDSGRIANGQNAAKGQFAYQVGLSLRLSAFQSAWCGGSLISQEWILTAAHCVEGVQSITAYLGGTVRTQADVTRSISKSNMIIHERWDTDNIRYDIALLKIASVPLSSNIQTVKLPSGTTNSYINSYVIASGWGLMGDSTSSTATNLQYGRMQVVANSQCSRYYGSTSVNSNTLCVATPDHTSPCQGDSGGPLVLESGDKVQIGLVSFGSRAGCSKGHPVVFTRVSSYLDWIRQKTGVSS